MVGAGALREALNAPEIESILSIGRQACGVEHPKLRELVLPDLFDFAAVENPPLLVRVFPFLFTTSEILGRAMLRIVEGRADRFILESADINRLGA
ncbi:MAG: hypothetical protein HOW73_18850 [Polyangiaceae bacterium]|nr:hypothetical protein [Polyangiaceae bacterium]